MCLTKPSFRPAFCLRVGPGTELADSEEMCRLLHPQAALGLRGESPRCRGLHGGGQGCRPPKGPRERCCGGTFVHVAQEVRGIRSSGAVASPAVDIRPHLEASGPALDYLKPGSLCCARSRNTEVQNTGPNDQDQSPCPTNPGWVSSGTWRNGDRRNQTRGGSCGICSACNISGTKKLGIQSWK